MGIFSFAQYIGVAQLVSWFLSEVIALCVAVNSSCPWESWSSKTFYIAILVDPSLHFLKSVRNLRTKGKLVAMDYGYPDFL